MDFSSQPEIDQLTNVTINGDYFGVRMNIKFFHDVVDLLRNEKPVTVTANSSNNIFILNTGKEPVGEEETLQLTKRFPLEIPRS